MGRNAWANERQYPVIVVSGDVADGVDGVLGS